MLDIDADEQIYSKEVFVLIYKVAQHLEMHIDKNKTKFMVFSIENG